jgi:PH (Pleckstrin Homology) domain-containing protein
MDATRPNTYRMGPESALYAFFGVCFAVLGLLGAIEVGAADFVPFGLLRLAGAGSIAAFLGLRMARLEVFVEEDGIRARNPFTTKVVPWSDIRGFTLHRTLLGDFGIAELHTGETVRLWGIQPRSRVAGARDRRAEMAVVSLNQQLHLVRVHGSLHSREQNAAQLQAGAPSAERT